MKGDNVLLLLVFGIFIIPLIYRFLANRYAPHNNDVGPLMSARSLLNSSRVSSLQKGKMAGFSYNLMAGNNDDVCIFVQLHKNTGLHLVAIGAKSGMGSQIHKQVVDNRLVKLDLEGNFPTLFSMYCSKNAEVELLQLFDASDMAYFADFCQAYDFELYHDGIYMMHAPGAEDVNDSTTLSADVEAFLTRNQALLGRIESIQQTLKKGNK